MKYILAVLLTFFSVYAFGQGSPTGAKTQFKNGVAVGSKDSSSFTANDSLFLTIDRNNRLMWRGNGTNAAWRVVSQVGGNDFIRNQTGSNLSAQTAKFWISDTIRTSGYVYGQNLYAVSANAIPGVTGINSSTGRGGSFSSQSGIGLAVQNSSTTNPAFKAIQNSTASIAQFYNNFDLGVMIDTSADITISNLRSGGAFTGKIKLPALSANREYTLPNASGTIALTSDTSFATLTLDRVLQNGNSSGRDATVGGFTATTGYFYSNLTSAARIRSDKAFFNSSSTTGFDTVLSVKGLSNAPGIVSVTSSGQAIRGVATGGATAITARSENFNGTALDVVHSAGGRLISANNGSSNVFTVDNGGEVAATSVVLSGNLTGTTVNLSGALSGTTTTMSGGYTSTTTGSSILTATTATTSHKSIRIDNTLGSFAAGVHGSSGNEIFNGGFPYASVFGSINNRSSHWATNNNVYVTLDSTGRLGVNQLNPSAVLDVVGTTELNGDVTIPSDKLKAGTSSTQLGANETSTFYNNANSFSVSAVNTAGANAATIGVWNQATSGDNKFLEFYTEGTITSRGSITYNRGSGVVAYNTTSDYRAKRDEQPIINATGAIMSLKPKSYFMLDGTRRTNGFFAHELQSVIPQAVTGTKDAKDSTGKPIYQQVDLSQIIPVLTKAFQEQQTKISELEARIAKLEAILNAQTKNK